MLNVLFISPEYRVKKVAGSDTRLSGLLKCLSREFEVTWVAPADATTTINSFLSNETNITIQPAYRKSYNRIINSINWRIYSYFGSYSFGTKKDIDAIIKEISKIKIQYKYIFLMYFAHGDFLKILKKQFPHSTVIIDTNDIQFLRYQRLFKLESSFLYYSRFFHLWKYKRQEISAFKIADILISLSFSDTEFFKKHSTAEIFYCKSGIEMDQDVILGEKSNNVAFFGAMNSISNYVAAKIFKESIFPKVKNVISSCNYYIVGSNPLPCVKELEDESTTVVGFVENLKTFFSDIKCVVCPFPVSYGERTRLYEIMALGIPCVVTSPAIEGMKLENIDGILIKDDYSGFAQSVIDILSDDKYRIRIGQSNRDWAMKNVSIDATYGKLTEYLKGR
jgi:glycosyltransferase involved in cell wall biosynthesis